MGRGIIFAIAHQNALIDHAEWFAGFPFWIEKEVGWKSPGGLPKGMKFTDLGRKSIRRNALIADLLHRITFIEKAGTGIKRMREEARDQRCPEPIFEENGFFTAIFYPNPEVRSQVDAKVTPSTAQVGTKLGPGRGQVQTHDQAHEKVEIAPQAPPKHPASTPKVTGQVAGQVGAKVALRKAHDGLEPGVLVPHMYGTSAAHAALLKAAMEPQTRGALQQVVAIRHRQHFYLEYLHPLLEAGLLELTIPEKPHSSKQRYRITDAGRALLKSLA